MILLLFAQLVIYPLIAQRPDFDGAVKPPPTADFAACCSAFSASTESIPFPTPKISQAPHFVVHMTARTPLDAVALRAFQYAPDGQLAWSVTSPAFAPADTFGPLFNAPRSVGFFIPIWWWESVPPGEVFFVVETRGSPVIYGAKLRVVYEVP